MEPPAVDLFPDRLREPGNFAVSGHFHIFFGLTWSDLVGRGSHRGAPMSTAPASASPASVTATAVMEPESRNLHAYGFQVHSPWQRFFFDLVKFTYIHLYLAKLAAIGSPARVRIWARLSGQSDFGPFAFPFGSLLLAVLFLAPPPDF